MSTMGKKDFFISYTQSDSEWAEWVAWQLEAFGYTTIIQAWDFLPGANFVLKMDEASQHAEKVVAILSKQYVAKAFTKPEWAVAFAKDPEGNERKLFPVRIEEFKPEGLLKQIICIDLVGLHEASAKDALLTGISDVRNKPGQAPAFPPKKKRQTSP